MALEVLSITKDLDEFGGAQKVLVDIHNGIKLTHKAKIIGFSKFEDIHSKYEIERDQYEVFRNPFHLNNKILIVHDRRIVTFIMALKRTLFLNTRVLYVAHCVYDTLSWASLFPKDIISISDKVTANLTNYFGLQDRNIRLIHNGIKDAGVTPVRKPGKKIIILYPAKIYGLKRQLEIIDNLSDKLSPEVEIHFAGMGPDYEKLLEKCGQNANFKALGFIENIDGLAVNVDYFMLFSEREGLPICLIEGIMHGKPILANDVGGNLEIFTPGLNGLFLDSWENLAGILNSLPLIPNDEYLKMSQNSRARYESVFKYDQMISKYIDVLNGMMV